MTRAPVQGVQPLGVRQAGGTPSQGAGGLEAGSRPAISWTGLKGAWRAQGVPVGAGPGAGALRLMPRHMPWAGLVSVGKVGCPPRWLTGHPLQKPRGAEGHGAGADRLPWSTRAQAPAQPGFAPSHGSRVVTYGFSCLLGRRHGPVGARAELPRLQGSPGDRGWAVGSRGGAGLLRLTVLRLL